MSKTRLNVSLDQDLAEFAKDFAAENRTSVANIVTQYLLALKRRVEGEYIETILGHPAFHYLLAPLSRFGDVRRIKRQLLR